MSIVESVASDQLSAFRQKWYFSCFHIDYIDPTNFLFVSEYTNAGVLQVSDEKALVVWGI